jgi:7-cyano-7-deazaguanine synthase in queuosine biosynthesis
MADRHVFCGAVSGRRGRPDDLRIDVNAPKGSPSRVNLAIEDLSGPLADNLPNALADLLEIAAYVYCADQFTSRGTTQMTDMGARWRRNFHFKVPVRELEIWKTPAIQDSLNDMLGFLSDDEFTFDFVQGSNSVPLQSYFNFSDPEAQVISPDEVILFSGGLDSLAGAVDSLLARQNRVALVSHRPSKMIASKQTSLVAALRERTGRNALFHVPVSINKGKEEATEFTQRTRSFLFATLGLIVARMFDRDELSFYENGIVSLNLPVAEHVIGARATRTTHPRFLADCSRLFSLLLGRNFTVKNPYLWKTKADIVRVLADNKCQNLIADSFSCARVREATKENRHCGVCSQCVDRRFGILAAGLEAYEGADKYVVDLFTGAHRHGDSLTMVESYVVRARKLATMSEQAFAATYGQSFRALPYLSGSPDQNLKNIWELHRRHGHEVVSVIDTELGKHATLARTLSLPATSLLAMIVSPITQQPGYADPIETEPTAPVQAASDTHDYPRLQVALAIDTAGCTIAFQEGIEFRGAIFELISVLAKQFEEDLAADTVKTEYRFVKASVLAGKLRIEQPSLRQRISRARKDLEKAFVQKLGYPLDTNDIIQNQGWSGYRLNPYLLIVQPAQLKGPSSTMSQLAQGAVTSRPAAE